MGRLRITDDVVRHLTTFQRLGETVEVELPGELMPIGARTVFRALRTRGAAQIGPDWVWPYWLERQLDPGSPAFVPRGHLPFLTNMTHRNWTAVGNLDSPWEAIVDPRGLVTPWFDGWSLDWWVGADDRWHLPSREVAVRQRLVADTPVVETAMRVPGGDVIERVYAVRRSSTEGGGELVIVEVENASRVPVAVALAVRPYNPEGLSVIERIGLHEGTTVTVDGRIAMLLPKPPPRVAASTFHDGDSAGIVMSGAAGERWRGTVRDPAGLAQAAFVYPLAHGTTLRVAMPLVPERRTRRRGEARRRVADAPDLPKALPPADAVARGWQSQSARGLRLGAARRPVGRGRRRQPALPAAAARRRRDHARPVDLPPVLVPRRRLPAGRPRPLRVPRRGRPGAALVPGPPARRRLLLQPAEGVGRQRRRPPRTGPALAR